MFNRLKKENSKVILLSDDIDIKDGKNLHRDGYSWEISSFEEGM